MRFAARDHRGVVLPIVHALTEAGHELVEDDSAELFLIDYDVDRFDYREWIDFYADAGATVLLYPHGNGVPPVHYDGLFEPYEKVAGQLAFGEGEERLLRTLDIQRPICNIGWVGVEQEEFSLCGHVKRVTFAPIHPGPSGTMLPCERKANERAFEQLLEGPWELTVRFLYRLEENGLWPDKRARYVMGVPDGSITEIDDADVVVAGWGSYLTLAVARGRPAVTYCQDAPASYGVPDDKVVERKRRNLYDKFVRYPYDLEAETVEKVVPHAALYEAHEWRKRWISPTLEPAELADKITRFAKEVRPKQRHKPVKRPTLPAEDRTAEFTQHFRDSRHGREWRWAPSETGVQVEGTRLRPAYGSDRYLELLKRAILNVCAPADENRYLRLLGLDGADDALSTSGYERLSYLQHALETVLRQDVPGDVIEVGVGRGGGAMLMRETLGEDERLLYAVDAYAETSLEEVHEHFVSYGIPTNRIKFVIGTFAAALPSLEGPWSLIRLDGGVEAIANGLECLCPSLSPGGYLIINDYEITRGSGGFIYPWYDKPPRYIDPVGVCWRKKEES